MSSQNTESAAGVKSALEAEVKAFVDHAADQLFAEFGGRHLFLSIHASRYSGGGSAEPAKYAFGHNSEPQFTAPTLAEVIKEARRRQSPKGKLAKVAELRREADELEASVRAASVLMEATA